MAAYPSDCPRALIVSKAIVPPFRDGSCCIVHELAKAMAGRTPFTVMTTRTAPALEGSEPGKSVEMLRIYRNPSSFSPAARDNLKVLAHLACDFRHNLWHFVFAPNPRAAVAARWLRRVRNVPVVQTIASQPRRFDLVQKSLFGDRIVTVSHYTANKLCSSGVPEDIVTVMPVPISDVSRDPSQCVKARKNLGIDPNVPMFVYAGDLEFSHGAVWMAQAALQIVEQLKDAVIVFACRAKTPQAQRQQQLLMARLKTLSDRVRFVGQIDDLPSLVASATALPFVVDDLYGKVDIPYVVLEAALLQVPVLVCQQGPLTELTPAPQAAPGDCRKIADFCIKMAEFPDERRSVGNSLRQYVLSHHCPQNAANIVLELYQSLVT